MIIILGAGIAGLTLANFLIQQGQEFLILEREAELKPVGAGIVLQNNGLAVMRALNLLAGLNGHKVEQIHLGYGQLKRSINTERTGLQAVCVHRSELQKLLLAAVDKKHIRLNSNIKDIQQTAEQVQVTLNSGEVINGQYLINCGGIHSAEHGPAKLWHSQQMCWRAIVSLKTPIADFGEYWFGAQRFGIAPISNSKAYVFHVIDMNSADYSEAMTDEQREHWLLSCAEAVSDVSQLDFNKAQWIKHPLQDRAINWGQGRVLAIGDAAHALTPNMGQGAVLAMEDAAILAQLIQQCTPKLDQALKQQRYKRVVKVHSQSRTMGRFAHNQSAIVRLLKGLMFRFAPFNKMARLQIHWMEQIIKQLD